MILLKIFSLGAKQKPPYLILTPSF